MGLDAAELIMEIEKTFGITFPERAEPPVAKLVTVGDLYHFILEQLAETKTETTHCLSAAISYQFRRALLASPALGLSRPQVHPGARMDDLFPEPGRRQEWTQLGELLRWRLPELVRPSWVFVLFFAMLLAWLAAIIAIWWVRGCIAGDLFLLVPALVFGSLGLGLLISHLTWPLARYFAGQCETVGDTIQTIRQLSFDRFSNELGGWNRREVWEILRTMISEQTAAPLEQVTESARLAKDLGMS